MSKVCSLCGNEIKGIQFNRNFSGHSCELCSVCAFKSDELYSKILEKRINAVKWSNNIISAGKINPLIKDSFIKEVTQQSKCSCDICGNENVSVKALDFEGHIFTVCDSCGKKLQPLIDLSDISEISLGLEWIKTAINSSSNNFTKITLMNISDRAQTYINTGGDALQSSVTTGNTSKTIGLQTINTVTKRTSIWITILKIISVISVVALTIVGGVLGGTFENYIEGGVLLGLFVGLIIGMILISVIMVFLDMAEDIKSTYAVNLNIQKLLIQINNKKQ